METAERREMAKSPEEVQEMLRNLETQVEATLAEVQRTWETFHPDGDVTAATMTQLAILQEKFKTAKEEAGRLSF